MMCRNHAPASWPAAHLYALSYREPSDFVQNRARLSARLGSTWLRRRQHIKRLIQADENAASQVLQLARRFTFSSALLSVSVSEIQAPGNCRPRRRNNGFWRLPFGAVRLAASRPSSRFSLRNTRTSRRRPLRPIASADRMQILAFLSGAYLLSRRPCLLFGFRGTTTNRREMKWDSCLDGATN